MELQRDVAVRRSRRGIGEVEDRDAVEDRDHVVALDLEQHVVPVGGPNHVFVLRRRPCEPAAAVTVESAGVMIHHAIDLELLALADVHRSRLEVGVEVDAAVAVGFALEADRQPEVLVLLLGAQVAVGVGHALAVDGAVLDGPLLLADLDPVGEVLAVEQLDPLLVGQRRAVRAAAGRRRNRRRQWRGKRSLLIGTGLDA